MGRITHMARRIDLTSRVAEATADAAPTVWDPKIARALIQRRQQQLSDRSDKSVDHPASGTELVQARLAEARARLEAEARGLSEAEAAAAD